MSREEKLDILRRVDKVARGDMRRVQEVTASLSGVYELILVVHRRHASGGCPSAGASSVSVRRRRWQRERGASGGGGRLVMKFFLADLDGEVRAMHGQKKQCVALVNLLPLLHQRAPMPVVVAQDLAAGRAVA